MDPQILLVDDDVELAEMLKDYPLREGFAAHAAHDSAPVIAVLRGDAELLHRAIENIVRNVLKHSPEGAGVDICHASEAEAGRVEIRGSDQGPGVAASSLPAQAVRQERACPRFLSEASKKFCAQPLDGLSSQRAGACSTPRMFLPHACRGKPSSVECTKVRGERSWPKVNCGVTKKRRNKSRPSSPPLRRAVSLFRRKRTSLQKRSPSRKRVGKN